MDANKLVKLQDINYRMCKVCGLCLHGNFPSYEWGTCRLYKYNHLKHSETTRELSIHKFGSCKHFELNESRINNLGTFKGFI